MISIGITYRKDVCPREIRTIEQFLDYVAGEHRVVVELVSRGTIDDTNFYGSYMYETRQRYSPDGGFIIGDAGDTVDPLYSHGLVLISLQARQVGEAIRRENAGEPVVEFVRELDIAFTNAHRLATREIMELFAVMHDGFRCHLRMHLAILLIFRLATPLMFNGYMWDPLGAKIFNRVLKRSAVAADLARWKHLIDLVSSIPANCAVGNYLKVQSRFSLNYDFFEHLREEDIPGSISSMLFYLARLRLSRLLRTGWRGAVAFDQHSALLRDLGRAATIRAVLHGTKPRASKLLRWLVAGAGSNRRRDILTPSADASTELSAPIR